MGDRLQPRLHIAALYWVVYAVDLCSKCCDRLLDRLATARLSGKHRPPDIDLKPTLPPGRSLT